MDKEVISIDNGVDRDVVDEINIVKRYRLNNQEEACLETL